ncbi:heterokaryon incompatibility protein-domain-containing protein [Xylaria sp. FL0043]|nr:heterokaryon incompatibility protein-domain-containing protein [Xylaria sp. FL0043]
MDQVISLPYRGNVIDQDDSFRLVYLEPGHGDSKIHVKLGNTRLAACPPYEALSYTWGDAAQTATIQISDDVDGSETIAHNVTANCFLALRRLRRPDERRALWIDAICINQSSTAERNHQLGLMAAIYAKASQVVVYLGDGDDESDAAMDIIANILGPPDYKQTWFSRHYGFTGVNFLTTSPDNCVAALFQRPWFSRIWVLQEIANARSATVYCGGKELPWESFRDFVHYNVAVKWLENIPFAVQYSARKSPRHWSVVSRRLLGMLMDTRSCGATDPRDKVFALLPLLEREKQLLRAAEAESDPETAVDTGVLLPDITLNYSLSPCDVFISLAVYFLKHIGLDTLRHIGQSSPNMTSLPSWVPDWSQPFKSRYRTIHVSEYQALPDLGPTRDYNISSFHELRVKATNCGVVKSIGGLCDIDNDHFPISEWQGLMPQEFHDDSSFPKLIAGGKLFYQDVVKAVISRVSEYELNGRDAVEDSELSTDPDIRNRPLRNVIVAFASPSLARQAKRVLDACDGRRLFVTDDREIGLAPENVEEGDVVFSIEGASHPFILRKVTVDGEVGNNYYKLVGECYLQGVEEIAAESSSEPIIIV